MTSLVSDQLHGVVLIRFKNSIFQNERREQIARSENEDATTGKDQVRNQGIQEDAKVCQMSSFLEHGIPGKRRRRRRPIDGDGSTTPGEI